MKTGFSGFPNNQDPPKWSRYFTAGDAWLETLQVLLDNKNNPNLSWSMFYVRPTIIAYCLEMYAKAIVAYSITNTDLHHDYGHKTSELITEYKNTVPLFNKIVSNLTLIKLVKEYEKTIDLKYADKGAQIDGDEQMSLINLIYELRKNICIVTKLR